MPSIRVVKSENENLGDAMHNAIHMCHLDFFKKRKCEDNNRGKEGLWVNETECKRRDAGARDHSSNARRSKY